MKKILLGIFLILLIFIVFLIFTLKSSLPNGGLLTSKQDVPTFSDWKEFEDPEKRFKVLLPFPPEYTKQAVEIPKSDKKRRYEVFVSQQMNGIHYIISAITYPPDFNASDTDEMIQDMINEILTSKPGNQVQEMKHSTFHDHKAINFHLLNKPYDIRGLAFIADKTVYLLAYVADLRNINLAEYDKFINSFQLLQATDKS